MASYQSAGLLLIAATLVAGCGTSSSSPTTPTPSTTSCSFSVSTPSTTTFGAEGGTATTTVTTTSGCSWTATSNAPGNAIAQGASGSGTGTVQFTVAANSATADRTGTLTIAGSTVSVTQRAAGVSPVTLSAPTAKTPIGGATVDNSRPTLTVTNATSTGTAGTITYRFEVSDLSSFPNDPARTFAVDGVAQGSGTTGWTLSRDLGPDVLWYWHARATNGTVTSEYSPIETFRTASTCAFTIAPTSIAAASGGGSYTATVTTASTCAWTATSNASFIAITQGASGTGTATVQFTVASNTTSGNRNGTLTIAGQTVTVTQPAAGLVASFVLYDPAAQAGATTECRFRSPTASPTFCSVQSTSYALGTTTIVSYEWLVQYTYSTPRVLRQSGSNAAISIFDTCGQAGSTDNGIAQPLSVTLTITDSAGNTATVTSDSATQPALYVRLFTCGS